MKDFNQLFDQWAITYDQTVYEGDNEYSEVFENYTYILEKIRNLIADKKDGLVLEIGVGTGNLMKLLSDHGFNVVGVEPSSEMRKICQSKLPNSEIIDGTFLSIPIPKKFDAIVTSYAFHHLNLEQKRKAICYLDNFINKGSRFVIADTMFESPEYKKQLLKYVENLNSFNLLHDLNTEYYDYIPEIGALFTELNYSFSLTKMNKYVWILSAIKEGKDNQEATVESFTIDHTSVKAPFIRKCKTMRTPRGDMITKFDLRFTQPNGEIMPTGAVHGLEHLLAGFLREEIDDIIDLSPMGCRTGFYLIKIGEAEEKEIARGLIKALCKILKADNIPAANPVQCGNYEDMSLTDAKLFANKMLVNIRTKYQL